jgi:nicotinamidase-related amidase
VSNTALDAVQKGFRTAFIVDASRGVDEMTVQRQCRKMREMGVVFLSSGEVMEACAQTKE